MDIVKATTIYEWALWLGFGGLMAMALLGASHFGGGHSHGHAHGDAGDFNLHGVAGAGHAGHAAHLGHGVGHAGHVGHVGHGAHGHAGGHGGHHHAGGFDKASLLVLLSPRLWFSVALGFGATGMLFHALIREPLLLLTALIGGLLGEWLVFGRFWRTLMKFQSDQARTLESAVAEEGRAATNFDADGHGLVALELDGQVLQLLGRLDESGRAQGVRVRTGDRVFVEDVDAARGRCTVSRMD